MFNFKKWIQMNILLPISPFLLRIFIIFIGKEEMSSKIKIFEMPELLFFSIFTCIVGLNVNIEGDKKHFESFLRMLLLIILILDFVVLGMIYSENAGANSLSFSIASALVPMIIAPLYKLYILKREEGEQ